MKNKLNDIIINELEKELPGLDWKWSSYEDAVEIYSVREFYYSNITFGDYAEQSFFDEYGGKLRSEEMKKYTPIFQIVDEKFEMRMDAIFGNLWREVFRLWMNRKFGLEIKTVLR